MDEDERVFEVTGFDTPVTITWHKDPTQQLLRRKLVNDRHESGSDAESLRSKSADDGEVSRADFEYRGETFMLAYSGADEIKVSDDQNTVSVKQAAGPTLYQVSGLRSSFSWRHDTLEDAINRACLELMKARKRLDPEFAQKEMADFMADLSAER